jgi:hypothetical protein
MTDQSLEKWPDPNEKMLLVLGRLTIRCAYLEGVVEDMMAGFLGLADTPIWIYPIVSKLPLATELSMLRDLAKLRVGAPEDFVALEDLIKTASTLIGFRNLLVHGLWAAKPNSEIAEVSETRTGKDALIRDKVQYCTEYYLEWLVEQIEYVMGRLFLFAQHYGLIIPASSRDK